MKFFDLRIFISSFLAFSFVGVLFFVALPSISTKIFMKFYYDICQTYSSIYDIRDTSFLAKQYVNEYTLKDFKDELLKDGFNFQTELIKADSGSLESMANVGFAYLSGIQTKKNIVKGLEYLTKAAKSNAKACFVLAFCYIHGELVGEVDLNKGYGFLVHGSKYPGKYGTLCKVDSGLQYITGDHIEFRSAETTLKYMHLAAREGDAKAQCLLGKLYLFPQYKDDYEGIAFRWYESSAKQNYPDGQYYLGLCYENGMGCEKNESEALKWYKKAAYNGSKGAIERIEVLEKD
mgnify:CR=1 FL=1